ncbi:MAG: hypothetical protein V1778_01255, partial [bacterium]
MEHPQSISSEQILAKREELLQRFGLKISTTFDTFAKEGGRKDVALVTKGREQLILRVGEVRPASFFPNGYIGHHFVVPRLEEYDTDGIPFELEEYIQGKHLWKTLVHGDDGRLAPEAWGFLLKVFWEFQDVGRSLPLEPK